MPKIESLDPRDRFTLQAEREFRTSVRPVYRNSESNPRPEHIGSCLLLNIDGVPLVVTAAHIMDQRTEYTLYIAGLPGTRTVPILGGVTASTLKLEEGRASDHFDTAMWIPPDQAVDRLGAVTFLNNSRISHIRKPSAGRLYTALGYPVSRNKKAVDHVTRSISTRMSMYTAHVDGMPELASKLRVTGHDHLFLRFEKRSFTGDGACENTFGPIGLSGGALLDLGDFTSAESYCAPPNGERTASRDGDRMSLGVPRARLSPDRHSHEWYSRRTRTSEEQFHVRCIRSALRPAKKGTHSDER